MSNENKPKEPTQPTPVRVPVNQPPPDRLIKEGQQPPKPKSHK